MMPQLMSFYDGNNTKASGYFQSNRCHLTEIILRPEVTDDPVDVELDPGVDARNSGSALPRPERDDSDQKHWRILSIKIGCFSNNE